MHGKFKIMPFYEVQMIFFWCDTKCVCYQVGSSCSSFKMLNFILSVWRKIHNSKIQRGEGMSNIEEGVNLKKGVVCKARGLCEHLCHRFCGHHF